ncbi:sugar phosphate nucleotidyltransferase [Paenibacillus gansuensis]|uniref:Sugar phosphate nucleotidyltransferase n=1 Tax=Paenibacillus gansuensis TaxID=306542 RepID=A0ABW5PFH5_9BACL
MKVILLSGGSGKRLWPLSNDSRSKQFLKMLRTKDGSLESMVQRVWGQLERSGLSEHSYIAANKSQLDILQNQLPKNLRYIVEPEIRDTFPAIALSATFVLSELGAALEETVVILPVDPYVEDDFFEKLKTLDAVLQQSNADLALIGVKPTFPSEKYGYIIPAGNENAAYSNVLSFSEKPNQAKANELISNGALWNCGVFAFKLRYLIQELNKRGIATNYRDLSEQYKSMQKISFDYEIVEKTQSIVVQKYEGYWKDLGTWNTLTEEMDADLIGKGIVYESVNTHVINELDVPVAVMGLQDVVVAVSPDGILVSDKETSPKIKDALNGYLQRPMYEEKRWGYYKILDYRTLDTGEEVIVKRTFIKAGCNLSTHKHVRRNEEWTVISGEGEFYLNDQVFPLLTGTHLKVTANHIHSARAITDLEIIEIQRGFDINEGDIIRESLNWPVNVVVGG